MKTLLRFLLSPIALIFVIVEQLIYGSKHVDMTVAYFDIGTGKWFVGNPKCRGGLEANSLVTSHLRELTKNSDLPMLEKVAIVIHLKTKRVLGSGIILSNAGQRVPVVGVSTRLYPLQGIKDGLAKWLKLEMGSQDNITFLHIRR